MKPNALANLSATALSVLLCFGILTLWVPGRWALSVYQCGALLLAASWTIHGAIRPGTLQVSAGLSLLALTALLGIGQLTVGITVHSWDTWNATLNWATNTALFFVALQVCGDAALRRRFLSTLLYFGSALSAISTLQMFTSQGKIFWIYPSGYTDLVLGPFVYRNQYAAFIESVLPLVLYRAFQEPHRAFRYWAMTAVMTASVVAGASRAGSILVCAEIIAVPLLAWKRRMAPGRQVAWGLARFAALALVATGVVGWAFLWQRFQQTDPFVVRREILLSSIEMARERPLTGFGLGTWATAYPAYALFDDGMIANQAHNDWAQWAVEGGIPMLAIMAAFAAMLIRPALRSIWGLGVLAVLLHSVVDYPMQQRPALAGWFFALAGALLAAAAGSAASAAHDRIGRSV